tara:strand:- start:215 stop:649 length:435 start_codon:yes stop_codon:yes gene_type:complete
MNDKFEVGQILYTTNQEKMSIIPIQIIERIEKITLTGKEINFIVKFPNEKETKVQLDKIKTQIFLNKEEIKNHMINNATKAIDKMLEISEVLINKKFQIQEEKNINQNKNDVQAGINDDIIMVDLGNGVKAKINQTNLEKLESQ